MMQFHNMNQQMMSYAQGMHQMMQQSGNSGMASMYGQMANRMQQMISKFPPVKGTAPSSSGASGAALMGHHYLSQIVAVSMGLTGQESKALSHHFSVLKLFRVTKKRW